MISGVPGFSFFTIEHIRKPGNHGKFPLAHFSRYKDSLSDFQHFSRYFMRSGHNSQIDAQSYQ